MNRRAPIVATVLLVVVCMAVAQESKAQSVDLVWLQINRTDAHPRLLALTQLAEELEKRTSLKVVASRSRVSIDSDAIFSNPLLFLSLEGPIELNKERTERLSRWLRAGGMLIIDYRGDPALSEQVRESVALLAGELNLGSELTMLGRDNILLRTFYRLQRPTGRVEIFGALHGAFVDNRLALVMSFNDLMGAFDKKVDGSWRFRTIPGGDRQRERAMRLGVNLVVYSLCLDYKDEKIHLDYLKKMRNWHPSSSDPATERRVY